MSYYSLKAREEEIKHNVAFDFFKEYDCRKMIGNIDFSVAIPQDGKELYPEIEYLLWAEAKKGALSNSSFHDAFIQLIFTIGRERTFDKNQPPKFLGAFDAEKIAFIPWTAVRDVFFQNDFNWNVPASDHESKEFKQLKDIVKKRLMETSKEKDNVYFFNFFNDKKDLQRFINKNFVSGRDDVLRTRVSYNNFPHIYEKWRREVKPSIAVDWENVKKNGLLDADFYLADIMSGDNNTLLENLHVLLKSNHYELDRKIDTDGLWASKSVPFNDNMQAHGKFWSKYSRPPRKEYWDKIVERRDLLVPQDIRERKGSYFTPRIWVEKSQEYLADVLGENWQDEYYIWDCCAGTGNLLAGLTNKYNIWASTIDKADVDVMFQRIEEMGDGSNLLKSHVFQFDFLNGDFSALPQGLQDIINDPEKRKKLVIYINPPYKEHPNARTVTGTDTHQTNIAKETKTYAKYLGDIKTAARELFAQFIYRIYIEIEGAYIANFSTLKVEQAPNFSAFRKVYSAKLEKLFIVPANTFDNVTGQFPIGFHIWNTKVKESFNGINADVFNSDAIFIEQKKIVNYEDDKFIIDWLRAYYDKEGEQKAFLRMLGTDFQHNKYITICNYLNQNDLEQHIYTFITSKNIIPMAMYLSIRQCIPATWLNDRDQFLYPNDGWRLDKNFQADCLAFALFHGQNKISSEYGINHWIPFTEQQVNAPDNFKSHFMSDFIAGKCAHANSATLFGEEESLIPTEPIVFTPAAQAVMEAGRKIWEYYMTHKKNVYGAAPTNVNASFYDIRAYFQGRDENGKMNKDSKDEKYNALIADLRAAQKVLAKQIEKKVYLYGFLKGEVEVNKDELLAEYQARVKNLEHQLAAQQQTSINNYGTVNIYEK